jgi:hypothetical protein
MQEIRERIRDELRSCVKRGLPLPRRPDPRDLWEVFGGDEKAGASALLVMLDFVAAEREVKLELQRARVREEALAA